MNAERAAAGGTVLGTLLLAVTTAWGGPAEQVAQAIRAETLRQGDNPNYVPLPLAAHWNTGRTTGRGFVPAWQMQMIEQGHHLLPWFAMPEPDASGPVGEYYESALRRCAELKLPITLIGTQWERLLSADNKYLALPAAQNPNVVGIDGKVQPKVSPFGPVSPWKEVGARWAKSPLLTELQKLYPDPQLVIFLSNNEHAKLVWNKVEESSRYLAAHGTGREDEYKRRVVGDGWIERYRALHAGLRFALAEPRWRAAASFVGYNAFGPWIYGRWGGWPSYSLHVTGRTSPWPITWNGSSLSYYCNHWESSTDYTVFSPQVQAMNWVFMRDEAFRQNRDFWLELSVWDGHQPGKSNDKRAFYASQGQTYTPQRYAGMVQFGMWLLRPRVVREFRGHVETRDTMEAWFVPIIAAVDRIHTNETLMRFWRRGRLVANTKYEHPYQSAIPAEVKPLARWFLLDTNLDPPRSWKLDTVLPVFALALSFNESPRREWLIYAHAPLGDKRNVKITVPQFGVVTVDVSVGGSFYLLREVGSSLQSVSP